VLTRKVAAPASLLDNDPAFENRVVLVRVVVKPARPLDSQRARRASLTGIQESDVVDRRTIGVDLNRVGAHGMRTGIIVEKGHVTADRDVNLHRRDARTGDRYRGVR